MGRRTLPRKTIDKRAVFVQNEKSLLCKALYERLRVEHNLQRIDFKKSVELGVGEEGDRENFHKNS